MENENETVVAEQPVQVDQKTAAEMGNVVNIKAVKKPKPAAKVTKAKAPEAKPLSKADAKMLKESRKRSAKIREKKAAEAKAAKAKRPEGAQLLSKGPGPAMKGFKVKVDKAIKPGLCQLHGCSAKAATKRAKWCREHKKTIRKAQLAANNVVWRKRVSEGTAGHHVAYRGKPTWWAVEKPKAALTLVKAGASIIEDPKKLEEALAKAAAAEKLRAAKQQEREAKAAAKEKTAAKSA